MQTYMRNPWSIFDALERSMFAAGSSEWPQFDIEDTDDETVLSADLPGMGEADIEVTVSAPYLVVRGERQTKEGRYLYRIEEALRRLYNDPKTFGTCHTCGSDVGFERLDALPHARYCIDCKRKEEESAA